MTTVRFLFLSVPDKCSLPFPSYFRFTGIFFFSHIKIYYTFRFSFRFSSKKIQYVFVFSTLATFPAPSFLLDLNIRKIISEEKISQCSSIWNFLQPSVSSRIFVTNILLSTTFLLLYMSMPYPSYRVPSILTL